MREIQLRAPIREPETLQCRLLELGFDGPVTTNQRDLIFDRPDASLFRSGKKIRLRIEDGRAELTYKGEFEGDEQASRREMISIEIRMEDVDLTAQILTRLGFPLCFELPKRRLSFSGHGVGVTIDDVPIVGSTIELTGTEEACSRLAAQIDGTLEFRGYRLSELLHRSELREGLPLRELKRRYEEATGRRLGRIELLLETDS